MARVDLCAVGKPGSIFFFNRPIKEVLMEDQVAYTSRVKIERIKGPLRRAYLPHVSTPVFFGVHSEIAQHYGVDTNVHEPHAATLDYVVAAAAG
jgi:hypothetical protein